MKYFNKTLLTLIATSLVSISAQAAVLDSAYDRQVYIGIKAGQFVIDKSNFDNPIAHGAFIGINLDPNFAVEAEYIGSTEADINIKNGSGEVDSNTYGLYASYRYYFPNTSLYSKAKLGFATTETDIMVKGVQDKRDLEIYGTGRDTSVAGGVALGYDINDYVSIEGEYAFLDADIDMMTIGAKVQY